MGIFIQRGENDPVENPVVERQNSKQNITIYY